MSAFMIVFFIIFILVMFLYAMVAAFKMKKFTDLTYEEFLVGGRTIGLSVTSLSLAATSLGGTSLNGVVEIIYSSGFVWATTLYAMPVGLLLGGLVFARRMHKSNCMTMLDPFQEKFGDVIPAIFTVLITIAEIVTTAALLSSFSHCVAVVMDLNLAFVNFMTCIFVCLYTAYGGLYAVAYSGIIQIVLGQFLWAPAIVAYNNDAVITNLPSDPEHPIAPFPDIMDIPLWIDYIILIIAGTMVSPLFYQRILSTKSAGFSQVAPILASIAVLFTYLPTAFIGYISIKTDFNMTEMGYHPMSEDRVHMLSFVLLYLTPTSVAVMGVFAVGACLMAAIDAGFLSSASLVVHHVYLPLRALCIKCSTCCVDEPADIEKVWVTRAFVVVFAIFAGLISYFSTLIFGWWYLLGDLVTIVLFPQLICALFIPLSNVWGSIAGLIFGILFRILAGEPMIHLPAATKYILYDEYTETNRFPFRSVIMILSLILIVIGSALTNCFITRKAKPEMADKKDAWFGHEGGYKKKSDDNITELPDKSDTQL